MRADFALAARNPGAAQTERFEQRRELFGVLLGEDFGGCHERGLQAVFHRLQARQRGDHGFAAADVALQQAPHRMRLCEVGADFRPGALLRGGERKRQRGEESGGQALLRGQRLRGQAAPLRRAAASNNCCASSSSNARRCQAGCRCDSSSASAACCGG